MTLDIENKVIEIFQNILGRDFQKEDFGVPRSDTPEWNSLSHVEIIFACEDRFQIEFTVEELSNLNSIKSFVDSISDKLS